MIGRTISHLCPFFGDCGGWPYGIWEYGRGGVWGYGAAPGMAGGVVIGGSWTW